MDQISDIDIFESEEQEEEYGLLGDKDLFDDLVDRLKLTRTSLFKKEIRQKKIPKGGNVENFFPYTIIIEMVQKLPVSIEQLKDINGAKLILEKYGAKFISDINHFIEIEELEKEQLTIQQNIYRRQNTEDNINPIKTMNVQSEAEVINVSKPIKRDYN